jgi:hypothetical protein
MCNLPAMGAGPARPITLFTIPGVCVFMERGGGWKLRSADQDSSGVDVPHHYGP